MLFSQLVLPWRSHRQGSGSSSGTAWGRSPFAWSDSRREPRGGAAPLRGTPSINRQHPLPPLTELPETAKLQSLEVASGASIHLTGPNFGPEIQYGRLCDNYVYNPRVRKSMMKTIENYKRRGYVRCINWGFILIAAGYITGILLVAFIGCCLGLFASVRHIADSNRRIRAHQLRLRH